MCGRYFRKSDKQRNAEAFHLGDIDIFGLLSEFRFKVKA
jgi:hypothetical protein